VGVLDADASRVRDGARRRPRRGVRFEGVVVDGTDVLAVYREAKRAIEKARAGGGPTLIECLTLRMEGHAVHDDAFYVPRRCSRVGENDPLERFRAGCARTPTCRRGGGRDPADVKKLLNDALSAPRSRRCPTLDADRRRLRDAGGSRHAPPQVMAELDLPPGDLGRPPHEMRATSASS
jgi:hypothetical protein